MGLGLVSPVRLDCAHSPTSAVWDIRSMECNTDARHHLDDTFRTRSTYIGTRLKTSTILGILGRVYIVDLSDCHGRDDRFVTSDSV